MAYSKDNAKGEEILQCIRKWKGYNALVNLPYFKGVWILEKDEINETFKVVRWYDKNYHALQDMKLPGWHPNPALSKAQTLKQTTKLDLDTNAGDSKLWTEALLKAEQERNYELRKIYHALDIPTENHLEYFHDMFKNLFKKEDTKP